MMKMGQGSVYLGEVGTSLYLREKPERMKGLVVNGHPMANRVFFDGI